MQKLEWMDRDEVIKRFLSVEFNRFLEYYKGAKNLNVSKEDPSNDRRREDRRRNKIQLSRFYINIGSKHKLAAANMIGLVNEVLENNSVEIGKIDILRGFSFFEVDRHYEDKVLQGFNGKDYRGNEIKVKIAKNDQFNPDNNPSDRDKKRKRHDKRGGGAKYQGKRNSNKRRR